MDAEKRSFLKTAKKWPKAIVPYKIDKKSIGKLFNYNSVCFISKILTIVLKFITSHIVLSLLKCVWFFFYLVDLQYDNRVTIFSKKQSTSSTLAPV